ncbi:NYN domain-containing protein [Verrucomicrobiaceae bacterium 5K15]|uniref:NYN domain-containing protein n=1 Tax=Oceaniferula flava TaxID=2800421 RepID=A0AAE2SBI8_9BACT|nr:NYN domain-containing protein [Oceaniferula flavus]MBK1853982.1 NYN domain-containing protein [Oceaniferula flavus]MBM1135288.1 NYN domain-containing protein [Oceaniferula flavus]
MPKRRRLKTILYIDGFNLYYGAIKDTPYKWLNPIALASQMFRNNEIVATKYCSAPVSALPNDPDAPTRQMTYWRALRTLPNMTIIEGHFRVRKKRAKVVTPPPNTIEIYSTEEKGSDVNLGAHLLLNAFQDKFTTAIVITGDSDLITPIRMVNEELGKAVCVVNPQLISGPHRRKQRRGSAGLQSAAQVYRNGIRDAQLQSSQFPSHLSDSVGTFNKPRVWSTQ